MKYLLAAIVVTLTALGSILLGWHGPTVAAIVAVVAACFVLPPVGRFMRTLFEAFRGSGAFPIVVLLTGFAAIFVSDDLFLVFKATFTIRLIQLLLIVAVLIGLKRLNGKPVRQWVMPIGFRNLLLWSLFVFAFVFNVPHFGLTRNLGYALWLVFNIALVLVVTNEADTEAKILFVLRCYVLGFFLLAVFGLAQFVLPPVGVPVPFIAQWWLTGILARINGISYEPSYYATYIGSGWVLVDYLNFKRVPLFSQRIMSIMFWSITAVLVLCSSRIGWITMAAWSALRLFWWIKEGNLRVKHLVAASAVGGVALLAVSLMGFDLPGVLFRGIIASDDVEAFSLNARQQDVANTLEVAKEHLILGVSLGGIGPQIAHNTNQPFDSEGEKVEGQSTTVEILAATGVMGLLVYLSYIGLLLVKPLLAKETSQTATIVKALAWSMAATLFSLQFNQTILRLILWFHIALLSAAYGILCAHRQVRSANATGAMAP